MKVSWQAILELLTNLEFIPYLNLCLQTSPFISLESHISRETVSSTLATSVVISLLCCASTDWGCWEIWRMTSLLPIVMCWTGQHFWWEESCRLFQAERPSLFKTSALLGTVMEELRSCRHGMISVLSRISQHNFPSEGWTMFLPSQDLFSVTPVPPAALSRMTAMKGSSQQFQPSHSFQKVSPSPLSGFYVTT